MGSKRNGDAGQEDAGYGQDPDADPEMLQTAQRQPDQAEGADDPSETG